MAAARALWDPPGRPLWGVGTSAPEPWRSALCTLPLPDQTGLVSAGTRSRPPTLPQSKPSTSCEWPSDHCPALLLLHEAHPPSHCVHALPALGLWLGVLWGDGASTGSPCRSVHCLPWSVPRVEVRLTRLGCECSVQPHASDLQSPHPTPLPQAPCSQSVGLTRATEFGRPPQRPLGLKTHTLPDTVPRMGVSETPSPQTGPVPGWTPSNGCVRERGRPCGAGHPPGEQREANSIPCALFAPLRAGGVPEGWCPGSSFGSGAPGGATGMHGGGSPLPPPPGAQGAGEAAHGGTQPPRPRTPG